jgi:hypothetical protein
MSGTPLNQVNLYKTPRPAGQTPMGLNGFAIGIDNEGYETIAITDKPTITQEDLTDNMPILPRWMHEKLSGQR